MSTWNRNPWLWALSLAGMDVQLDVQDVQLDIRFHPWSKVRFSNNRITQGDGNPPPKTRSASRPSNVTFPQAQHPQAQLPQTQLPTASSMPLGDPFTVFNGFQYHLPYLSPSVIPPNAQQTWSPHPLSSPLNPQMQQSLGQQLGSWNLGQQALSPDDGPTIHERVYDDDNDYDDGAGDDDEPGVMLEPSSSVQATVQHEHPQLAPRPGQDIPDPDHAPIQPRKRQAEPAITNSEPRDLQPATRRRLDLVISTDATSTTNPTSPVESLPLALALPQTPTRTAGSVTAKYTPFRLALVSKPLLRPQSPTTTTLAKAAGTQYKIHLVTVDAFPVKAERVVLIEQFFADASPLVRDKGPRRLERYKSDGNYKLTIYRLIGRVTIRGDVPIRRYRSTLYRRFARTSWPIYPPHWLAATSTDARGA
ncbi:hypothetical protein AURDEDRAFT_159220 [Auricularia subglabra TFB-10046 SS5]|nr:hypothetical protein AURDEDRAFT_159220 [Auricularia subglabra TFB-10046 SS5]